MMSLKLHCNENERQWLTAEIDGDETILNIFSGEMGVEVPVVLSREQTQQLIDHLPCKGSMQAHIDNQAARIAELEQQIKSQLICDGLPTFYISQEGMVCTHRLSESDTPVWCRTGDDGLKAMQGAEIPKFLIEMSEQLNTQDNRITAEPIFQVRCKRSKVTADGFQDWVEWVNKDADYDVICRDDDSPLMTEYLVENFPDWISRFVSDNDIEAEDFADYFDLNLHDDELPDALEKFYVTEYEDIVKSCLTEADAQAFIDRKQHDYPPLYIYVESMTFCPQMIELRNWIMSITTGAAQNASR